MHLRKLIRDSLGFAVTQSVVRAALMLRGVIGARLLGPQAYGAWNALTLILDYGMFSTLGTQQGLDQAVPARIVDGDQARLLRLKRAGLFNMALSVALFTALVLAFFAQSTGATRAFWGMRGVAATLACVVLTVLANYHLSIQRSHGDITSVSAWFAIQGGLGTVLGLSLIPACGAWGLLWGWLASAVAALAYARWKSPPSVPLMPRPSIDCIELLRVGFPMYLYLGANLVMRSIDRVVVLRFVGVEGLGYYSLGVMALTLLLYLPDSVAYVLYPHFLRRYHEGGDQPEAIRATALRTLRFLTVVVAGLCGVTFLAAREAVVALLPSFIPGATVVRVLCFGAAGLAVANLSSILLMTLGRQLQLIPAALFLTTVGAALDYAVLRAGYGIDGVAWATFVTYFLNGALMMWLACAGLGLSPGKRLLELARSYLPIATSLVLAAGLSALLRGQQPASLGARGVHLGLAVLGFASLYSAAVYPLVRGLGLRRIMIEIRGPLLGNGRRAPDAAV